MNQYEFKSFGKDAQENETVEYHSLVSDSAARSKAGRMSMKIEGPVDIARAGSADWDVRYMTTAAPSDYHTTGYRFERLI